MKRVKAENAHLSRRVVELEELLTAMQTALQAEDQSQSQLQLQVSSSKEWV